MTRNVFWLLLLLPFSPVIAEPEAIGPGRDTTASGSGSAGSVQGPREWGIHNGCIGHTRIKQVNFTSNDAGIIELADGRKVEVTLRNSCSGIRNEGYVHKPVNGKFCEGDILRVIHFGTVCIVDRIRPYIVATDD